MMRQVLGVVLLLVVGSAQAATIIYSSPGVVTGIGGLDIGGTLYDVDFETGVYSTFGGSEDFWSTQAEVAVAITEINTLLSADSANCEINNPGSLAHDCAPGLYNVIASYSVLYNGGTAERVSRLEFLDDGNGGFNLWNALSCDSPNRNCDPDGQLTTAWSVSAVPVPAAVWLFGSALAGLGWFRRRQSA